MADKAKCKCGKELVTHSGIGLGDKCYKARRKKQTVANNKTWRKRDEKGKTDPRYVYGDHLTTYGVKHLDEVRKVYKDMKKSDPDTAKVFGKMIAKAEEKIAKTAAAKSKKKDVKKTEKKVKAKKTESKKSQTKATGPTAAAA